MLVKRRRFLQPGLALPVVGLFDKVYADSTSV
jgi:hypothetical protein